MSKKKAARPELRIVEQASISMPDDEKELLKTVPAKVDDVVVGEALIFDDGSVEVIFDADAPADKVEKVRELEKQKSLMYQAINSQED